MDLKWFLRYLTFNRWSRFFAVFFALIFFSILAYFFLVLQKNYRQKEWHFKNTGPIARGLMLEANRIYKIEWEDTDVCHPSEIQINGSSSHLLNYFKLPYARATLSTCCNIHMTSPSYFRVKNNTDFKLSFIVYSPLEWNSGFGSFFKSWLKSFSDPVQEINWTVTDVTETEKNAYLLVDGKFPINALNR
jgi:hypothetical protein